MCAPKHEQQEEAKRLDGKLKRGRRDAVCRERARGRERWLGWLQQADLHASQCWLTVTSYWHKTDRYWTMSHERFMPRQSINPKHTSTALSCDRQQAASLTSQVSKE